MFKKLPLAILALLSFAFSGLNAQNDCEDNLLGIMHNEESYRHYWTCFQQAQKSRRIEGPSDNLKKSFRWNYEEFLRAPVASQIPQVADFKRQMARLEN